MLGDSHASIRSENTQVATGVLAPAPSPRSPGVPSPRADVDEACSPPARRPRAHYLEGHDSMGSMLSNPFTPGHRRRREQREREEAELAKAAREWKAGMYPQCAGSASFIVTLGCFMALVAAMGSVESVAIHKDRRSESCGIFRCKGAGFRDVNRQPCDDRNMHIVAVQAFWVLGTTITAMLCFGHLTLACSITNVDFVPFLVRGHLADVVCMVVVIPVLWLWWERHLCGWRMSDYYTISWAVMLAHFIVFIDLIHALLLWCHCRQRGVSMFFSGRARRTEPEEEPGFESASHAACTEDDHA